MASRGILAARAQVARRRLDEVIGQARAAGLDLPAARPLTKSEEVNAVQQAEDLAGQMEFLIGQMAKVKAAPSQPPTKTESPAPAVSAESPNAGRRTVTR